MLDYPIIKSIGLLVLILGGVLIGTHEVAKFFLEDKRFRKFWLKVWFVVAVIIGVILWIILIFWGK